VDRRRAGQEELSATRRGQLEAVGVVACAAALVSGGLLFDESLDALALDVPEEPDGLVVLDAFDALEDEPPSPLLVDDEAYRSLYQPPPLSWNEVRLIALTMVPGLPQDGHASGGGSLCFWSTSSRWAQASQRYSNKGMR
jgi:hypothetical protein